MRDDSAARTDMMALDNDAFKVAQGFGLMLGKLPFHPFDAHHQPRRGRQSVPGDGPSQRYRGNTYQRLIKFIGDSPALRIIRRPIDGDLIDPFGDDGTVH